MKNMSTRVIVSAMALCLALVGCQKAQNEGGICRIHGTMESAQWDGKRIFLVPMFGPKDSAHVDSLVIENGKFEFEVDTAEMKIIRVDYHYRMGTQDLLVITEPGDVNVMIGGISSGGGTPQNDSLQVMKDRWQEISIAYNEVKKRAKEERNDNILMTEGKAIQAELRDFNIAFAQRQPDGILKEYLNKMYPYTTRKAEDKTAE